MRTFVEKSIISIFVIAELSLIPSFFLEHILSEKGEKLLLVAMGLVFLSFLLGIKYANKHFREFYFVGLIYAIFMDFGFFAAAMNWISPEQYLRIAGIMFAALIIILFVQIATFSKNRHL